MTSQPDHAPNAPLTELPEAEAEAQRRLARVFFGNWLEKRFTGPTFRYLIPTMTQNVNHLPFAEALEECFAQKGITVERFDLNCYQTLKQNDLYLDCLVFVKGLEHSNLGDVETMLAAFKNRMSPEALLFLRTKEVVRPFTKEMNWEDMDYLSFAYVLRGLGKYQILQTYTIGEERDFLLDMKAKPYKICCGMIAKNEERDLPLMLKSLGSEVDGLVFIDTGSTDKTLEIAAQWAQDMKVQNPDFYFHSEVYTGASTQDEKGDWKLWNFSQARNRYVDHIEQTGKFDYVLWMDADDELMTRQLRDLTMLREVDAHGIKIKDGTLMWPHHRLWKTGRGTRYTGRCHEYPGWSGKDLIHDNVVIKHDGAAHGAESSNTRNLRILEKEWAEEPRSRVAFYLANTYKDRGEYIQAASMYSERMKFGKDFPDEYWFAVLYKGRCLRLARQFEEAEKTLLLGAHERPDWAEFWMELSYTKYESGDYRKALGFAMQAQDRPVPPTPLFRERDKYTDQPYRYGSWAAYNMGMYELALEYAVRVQEMLPDDESWSKQVETIALKCAATRRELRGT